MGVSVNISVSLDDHFDAFIAAKAARMS